MYYEEKFIDGKLMFRTMPDGYWMQKETTVAKIANKLMQLTEEERMEVFGYFCQACGTADLPCYCMRDE